jgi:hypothetical protein
MTSEHSSAVMEKLDVIESLIRVMVRQKMSNKQEKLMDEVTKRGRFSTQQVMDYVGVSRTQALIYMKNIGKNAGYRFSKGDPKTKMSSALLYNESMVLKDQYQQITNLLKETKMVTLADLMRLFQMNLQGAKHLAQEYLELHKECELQDDNKIIFREQTTTI